VAVGGELRFTVLRGTVGALADGTPVALGGPQQRRLLAALLANHDTVVSTDRLVETVWPPDEAPGDARRTVMTYVSRLRAAIGEDHLITRDQGYELTLVGAGLDAADFELALAEARAAEGADAVVAYERALALWSGRAYGDDADEWWLQPVAGRLEELRLVASAEHAEALIDDGRHADAVVELETLAADQPLREHFVELLMRALYLGGRQAEALRCFQRFRTYLAEETGLEPSDALVDLDRRITQGDPSLAPESTVAVPGYELAEVIGEGAFGAVYRGVQPSVGREVAVKVVRPELADDPRFVQRFEAEAQLVARIEHPHVVPLYDFWRRPGGAFLVFRLLRGGSLADRLSEGPLDVAEAGRLIEEIGGALSAAHALGVVHRDVKPANILFDETANSYLADFGIAEVGEREVDELDLRSAGSPLYASPEQVRDATATPASDQYALGVVVWEALCGRPPFSGTTVTEVTRTKLLDAVPPLDPEVEGADVIGPILAKATAPHPEDRYDAVADLVAAWRSAVAGTDVLRTTSRLPAGDVARVASPTVASVGVAGLNPYKGLRAFQEADAAEYCGRDELVSRLVQRVEDESFVTVVGPSGSGKSSLVHAGLISRLRRRGALAVSMVPGVDPLEELRMALRRVATTADAATIDARLRTPGGLAAMAQDLVGPDEQLVLVVDQFEELWTLANDAATRDQVAELLAHGGEASGSLRIVVTLRADQYDLPLQHPTLGPVVSTSTFAVTPMTAPELRDAVVLPAERVGVRFEPQLVPRIVDDVVSRPGALPLLQFALTELYERRHGATVTTDAYEALGGIGGALARRAEELFAATPVERQGDVHRLFTQLVTTGDDADDLRRRATLEELADVDPAVVEAYRASRLIVTDHHPVTREPTVEVAHEALLREWPRLVAWIDEDRDAIRIRRGIGLAAAEWQDAPDDESILLRGTRLAAADEVARTLRLTSGEQDFLTASRELADRERLEAERRATHQRRQNRRLRRLLAGVGILLVAALVAGVLAVQQSRRSEREAAAATQARLLADAERLATSDRDLSMLLAAEAARREPGTVGPSNALATSMLVEDDFLRYVGDTETPRSRPDPVVQTFDVPGFSPDGSQLVVPDSDARRLRVVDVVGDGDGRTVPYPAMEGDPALLGAAWLPSGTLLLVADDQVVGIDAETGVVELATTPVPGPVLNWAVDEAGQRVALASAESVTLLDPATGATVAMPTPCCATGTVAGPGAVTVELTVAVAWRGDELFVASGSGVVERWDGATGRRIATLPGQVVLPFDIRLPGDGTTLVVSGIDPGGAGRTMAYDAETGGALWSDAPPVAGSIADDPRHDAVVVADRLGGSGLRRYGLATGEAGQVFDTQTGVPCLAITSAGGRHLAAASCARSAVALWALDGSGAAIEHLVDSDMAVWGRIFTADGRYAVLDGPDPTAPEHLYELDVRSGALTPFDPPAGYLPNSVVNPDHRLVVGAADGRVIQTSDVVERPSGPLTWDPPPPYRLTGVPSASDVVGDVALLQYGGEVNQVVLVPRLRESADSVLLDYEGGSIGNALVRAGGREVLVGGTEGLRIYDLEGELVDEPFDGYFLALDEDRRTLAVSALDGTLTFYDADSLDALGPAAPVVPGSNLTLSDDGTMVRAVDARHRLQMFDVASGEPIGPLFELGVGSESEFEPGSHSMLLQRDGSIVRLSFEPADLLEAACLAAGRNLTVEEWATYVGGSPQATCPQWPAPS